MAYDDMIAVRDSLLSAIDNEMLKVSDDSVYSALSLAYSSVWNDMTVRDIISFSNGEHTTHIAHISVKVSPYIHHYTIPLFQQSSIHSSGQRRVQSLTT